MTNFERIKAMSVEEMAEWIAGRPQCAYKYEACYGMSCAECYADWLKEEVQDEAD